MNSKLPRGVGRVTVDGDHATLAFERRLPHPPEVVWRAITDPKELAEWYMTTARIDGRVGGSIDFWSGPSRFHVTGSIIVWDPPRTFEYEWNVDPRPELPGGERSIVTWELAGEGEGTTLLRLTHRHLTRRTSAGFGPGSHAFLDRLEAHLEARPLPDWRKRVEELRASYPGWSS